MEVTLSGVPIQWVQRTVAAWNGESYPEISRCVKHQGIGMFYVKKVPSIPTQVIVRALKVCSTHENPILKQFYVIWDLDRCSKRICCPEFQRGKILFARLLLWQLWSVRALNVACYSRRFLKPSQVPGIDTEAFMRQQQIACNLHEQSILGYRGLVGELILVVLLILTIHN